MSSHLFFSPFASPFSPLLAYLLLSQLSTCLSKSKQRKDKCSPSINACSGLSDLTLVFEEVAACGGGATPTYWPLRGGEGGAKYVEGPPDNAKGDVSRRSSGGVDGLGTSDKGEENGEGSFERVTPERETPQGKLVSIVVLKHK